MNNPANHFHDYRREAFNDGWGAQDADPDDPLERGKSRSDCEIFLEFFETVFSDLLNSGFRITA